MENHIVSELQQRFVIFLGQYHQIAFLREFFWNRDDVHKLMIDDENKKVKGESA